MARSPLVAVASPRISPHPVAVEREPRLDAVAPAAVARRLAARFPDAPTLLLDAPVTGPLASFAFVAADPVARLVATGRAGDGQVASHVDAPADAILTASDLRELDRGPLFDVLSDALALAPPGHVAGAPPFQGGFAGFLSYDAGRLVERVPSTAIDDRGLPVADLSFHDVVIAWNKGSGEAFIIARAVPDDWRVASVPDRAARIRQAAIGPDVAPGPWRAGALEPGMTRASFEARVARARAHVRDGDVYQANLSHRFTASFDGDPWGLYEALGRANPAPFAGAWVTPGHAVLSSSPERLVATRGGRATMRPIAGTRPRGDTDVRDRALAEELREDEKERAEHVMLVDLARNDLGRICRYGSVAVDDFMTVESYRRVHHLVSGVSGELSSGIGPADVIRATFPGGTITGAPKVRAMEVIEELEPVRRHAYTGALGYITPGGDLDFNILIRTLTVSHGPVGRRVDLQVGAGIVHDSDPGREYLETLAKARAMREALEGAA